MSDDLHVSQLNRRDVRNRRSHARKFVAAGFGRNPATGRNRKKIASLEKELVPQFRGDAGDASDDAVLSGSFHRP